MADVWFPEVSMITATSVQSLLFVRSLSDRVKRPLQVDCITMFQAGTAQGPSLASVPFLAPLSPFIQPAVESFVSPLILPHPCSWKKLS